MIVPSPHLVVLGAAHIDRIAHLDGPATASSVPGRLSSFSGGAAFNAARHVRAAGFDVEQWTPGDIDLVRASAHGVRLRQLGHSDIAAPSYTAVLAPDGELVVAVSDMRRYDELLAEVPKTVATAANLLVDANLPAHFLAEIAAEAQPDARLFAMAVSPAKIAKLVPIASRIDVLFANRAEFDVLSDSDASRFRSILRSEGPNGFVHLGPQRRTPHPVAPIAAVDVTGAGDAATGGFLAALLAGSELEDALSAAERAARRTILVEGPFPFEEPV